MPRKTTKTKPNKTSTGPTKLVIVESPTKAKTLSKFLGKDYTVDASMGHIRDLPKKKLGVDVEHNFEPEYEIPSKAKKTISALKAELPNATEIVLATDPDREGEAIAWHLKEILSKSKDAKNVPFSRVVFHEITKEAVNEAFEHASDIDLNMVDAQQARRVLDRLVGYNLSPLLWKKVRYGLSAGRVQSVAVRLIVERERERMAFKADEYWTIDGMFTSAKKEEFKASLEKIEGKKAEITNEKSAKEIEEALKDDLFNVTSVKKTQRKRAAYPPYKTSTLQQAAANAFGYSAKRTMSAAQKLFEHGFITYHRTDSTNLSNQFIDAVRAKIKKDLGAKYLPEKPIFYASKSKNAQEAHEAIRPTDLNATVAELKKKKLSTEAQKVYSLILKRAIECQTMPAVYDQTTILINSAKGYEFKATGSIVIFDGWLAVGKLIGLKSDSNGMTYLPEIEENSQVTLNTLESVQHFTQPPARYSDATLIKALEEQGIGRPSTYAPTISTIIARGYVGREGRYFVPNDVSYVVTDLLVEHFPNVVGYEFTANMEDDLDEIAAGNKKWVPVVKEFYDPFKKTVDAKDKELHKADVTNLGQSDEKCPDCGKPLNIKLGKYGKFLSCSGFPKCEYAKPLKEDIPTDEEGNEITEFGKCENCEDGVMILKKGRFGKFLACSNYPKCKTTKPYLEKIGVPCPECENGELIVKKAKGRTFYGCSNYPECKYSTWKKPEGAKIDIDGTNGEEKKDFDAVGVEVEEVVLE